MSAQDDWDFIEDNYDNDNDFEVEDKKSPVKDTKADVNKSDKLDDLAEMESSKQKKEEPPLVDNPKTPSEEVGDENYEYYDEED